MDEFLAYVLGSGNSGGSGSEKNSTWGWLCIIHSGLYNEESKGSLHGFKTASLLAETTMLTPVLLESHSNNMN